MKTIIQTKSAPNAIGPYSQAVIFNGILYTSGQIAIDPNTGKVQDESIETEANQVMKNLSSLLKEADTNFSNVIKTSIFLSNMDDFSAVNHIYAAYFSDENYPARETVEVAKLPKGVRVEISMIAFI